MNKQINLRLSQALLKKAEVETEKRGFENIQELIKDLLRKNLYETQEVTVEEMAFLKDLYRISEKHNLYGTEKDLFDVLNKK